jgi:hypothetical protein
MPPTGSSRKAYSDPSRGRTQARPSRVEPRHCLFRNSQRRGWHREKQSRAAPIAFPCARPRPAKSIKRFEWVDP